VPPAEYAGEVFPSGYGPPAGRLQLVATVSGIKVRGKCPDGHQYTTTAPAGRVTWTGPCPTCSKPMTARRLPSAEQATAAVDPAPGDPGSGELVVKKARYKDAPPDPRPKEPEQDDEAPPDRGDEDDEPAGAGAGGAEPDPGPEPDSVGGNPGIREARGPARADDDGEREPGGESSPGAAGSRRDRRGRWSRARRRRAYPGVPYGA
jgi:hypothetical protein